jgi:hypothetical protein
MGPSLFRCNTPFVFSWSRQWFFIRLAGVSVFHLAFFRPAFFLHVIFTVFSSVYYFLHYWLHPYFFPIGEIILFCTFFEPSQKTLFLRPVICFHPYKSVHASLPYSKTATAITEWSLSCTFVSFSSPVFCIFFTHILKRLNFRVYIVVSFICHTTA